MGQSTYSYVHLRMAYISFTQKARLKQAINAAQIGLQEPQGYAIKALLHNFFPHVNDKVLTILDNTTIISS